MTPEMIYGISVVMFVFGALAVIFYYEWKNILKKIKRGFD